LGVAADNKCVNIRDPRGYSYTECDPQKIKEAHEEIREWLKANPPKAPAKPGHEQSVEEFKANMKVEQAKSDEERRVARQKADDVRAREDKARVEQARKAAAEEAARPAPTRTGNWKATLDENKMDSRARLVLTLEGDEALPSRITRRKPALVVRCEAGKVDLYLAAQTHLSGPSDELGQHRFRAKYDGGKPESLIGAKSTSNDAVFFPHAAAHVKRIRYARDLIVEVTPYTFAPSTTTFRVAGIDQHKDLMDKHCNVK
jgi:hypothetical protein